MRTAAIALSCICSMLALSSEARAEDVQRVFLRVVGEPSEAAALEEAAVYFRAPVLETGTVEFAGTTEMDAVFAECREQMGVSATEERRCRLMAARRIFVEQVIELRVKSDGASRKFALSVWDPNSNGLVFETVVAGPGTSVETGAASALPQLADRYLCFRGVEARCTTTAEPVQPTVGPAQTTPSEQTKPPLPLSESDASVLAVAHRGETHEGIEMLRTYRSRGLSGVNLLVPDGIKVGTAGDAIVALGMPERGLDITVEQTPFATIDASMEQEVTASLQDNATLDGFGWVSEGMEFETFSGRPALVGTFRFVWEGEARRRTLALVEAGSENLVVTCTGPDDSNDPYGRVCPRMVRSTEYFKLYEQKDVPGFSMATPGHWYNAPDDPAQLAKHGSGERWGRDRVEAWLLPPISSAADPASALAEVVPIEESDTWVSDGMVRERVAGADGYVGVVERDVGLGKVRLAHVVVPTASSTLRVTCTFEAGRTSVMLPACLHMANSAQVDPNHVPTSPSPRRAACAHCSLGRPVKGLPSVWLLGLGILAWAALRRRRTHAAG